MGQLLDRGASIEGQGGYGWTPLGLAAEYGHEAVVRQLLDRGASIEGQDRDGQTPLGWAAEYGQEAVVQLLKSHLTQLSS